MRTGQKAQKRTRERKTDYFRLSSVSVKDWSRTEEPRQIQDRASSRATSRETEMEQDPSGVSNEEQASWALVRTGL